ncbi:MAG: TetR/AcrR family transcriptional regulator [Emcibacter sp.]|nr:TetR/AcrR family transcriptional regulator [Emcibacter sp.]
MPKNTAAPKNIKLRRAPAQKRAQESVNRIFDATKDILGTEGIDKLSTNRIAAMAQMSTGAIYNFFPNKEAILYALVDNWLSDLKDKYEEASENPERFSTPFEWINLILQINENSYAQEPIVAKYYNALTIIPDILQRDIQHDEEAANILAKPQMYFAPDLSEQQAKINAQTMVQMIHGVLVSTVSREPHFSEMMKKELKYCLSCLVSKYLL